MRAARAAQVRAVAARVRRLGDWVRSPAFVRKRRGGDRLDALLEAGRLRDELLLLRARAAQDAQDDSDWGEALAWVAADRGEAEADMLETLARSIPRRAGETAKAYASRLREFRRGVAAEP